MGIVSSQYVRGKPNDEKVFAAVVAVAVLSLGLLTIPTATLVEHSLLSQRFTGV
jgi:hypothetical protein